jgi:hypothetical protein
MPSSLKHPLLEDLVAEVVAFGSVLDHSQSLAAVRHHLRGGKNSQNRRRSITIEVAWLSTSVTE